ncbi:dTDP-4-dehydrorhamnose reductase [Sphingosinicella sp. BN140058]|uniref:dTDP-4-dehydrorhamnose reductase n=1 Tax=Sphingosinicella sp. BN140058 TaxID=1892855 RepID=UPI001010F1E2|nr:dTDP-4-dehydrorhamnose reductase [Sphingosinicella sp. BN140058]QAY75713.1 dTDP-4-dehydrorhamnose reductase [Sphingosinicella sp. BN140058]
MKVLIFGAAGQVGRALAAFAPPEAELVALDRHGCDISDPGAAADAIARHRPAWIFNAAGYTAVDRAESEPDAAQRVNGDAPGWMAQAAHAIGAKMVHLSSDFVFDGTASRPLRADSPARPISVYGHTKRHGELAVVAACPDALIVRTAWVYDREGPNFVTAMLRRMSAGGELRVVADQIGTPTWARSLATAVWALADSGASGIHHFTDAGIASWYDFAVAIEEEAVSAGLIERAGPIVPIASADYATQARRPAFSVLDKSATWGVLGTHPPHWRANLRACLTGKP